MAEKLIAEGTIEEQIKENEDLEILVEELQNQVFPIQDEIKT